MHKEERQAEWELKKYINSSSGNLKNFEHVGVDGRLIMK
jgi:hypothetical protein